MAQGEHRVLACIAAACRCLVSMLGVKAKRPNGAMATQLEQQPVAGLAADAGIDGMGLRTLASAA